MIDTFSIHIGQLFERIRDKAFGKERHVLLKIKEIVVNHPNKWVIRDEQGDNLILNKKYCPSPTALLKTAGTSVTVRGSKIISINFENDLGLGTPPDIATRISNTRHSSLADSSKLREENTDRARN